MLAVVVGLSVAAAGCGSTHPAKGAASPTTAVSGPAATHAPAPSSTPSTTSVRPRRHHKAPSTTTVPVPKTTVAPTTAITVAEPLAGQPPAVPDTGDGGPATLAPTGHGDLSGKVVAVDPGHNGHNYEDPSFVNALIFNGREEEACDTTGTETDGGYTEAEYNFNVAEYLAADLRARGATVVLTRTTNTGVGPCVTVRAAIGNAAHADVAVSIHADGGPAGGRGYTVLEPVADGPNDAIIGPSDVLAVDLRDVFGGATGTSVSDYYGADGLEPRDDLGGLNLSTVPKVLIETANMRNASDALLVTTPAWQARAAAGIATGLADFLLHVNPTG